MPNFETPSPGGTDGVSLDAVADAVETEVAELHRIGVTRAQAVDSLHTVANDLIQHLITPTPGPAQRNALACADALRAAATLLADHDDAPTGWAPTELQHDHPAPAVPAEYPTVPAPSTAATMPAPSTAATMPAPSTAATMPTPSTDTLHSPTPQSPAPQYPPGLDVSKYVRAPLAPQHPDRT